MIVLTIGAIFIVSLVFFFYLVFGKIENENQGVYESLGSERPVRNKPMKENLKPLKTYKVEREKEVVLK